MIEWEWAGPGPGETTAVASAWEMLEGETRQGKRGGLVRPHTGEYLVGKIRSTPNPSSQMHGGRPRQRDRVGPGHSGRYLQQACPSYHHLREIKAVVERGHSIQQRGARPGHQKGKEGAASKQEVGMAKRALKRAIKKAR